jgi:hypothetical protein
VNGFARVVVVPTKWPLQHERKTGFSARCLKINTPASVGASSRIDDLEGSIARMPQQGTEGCFSTIKSLEINE